MTRTTNAKVAGFAFLFYDAATLVGGYLWIKATRADGITAKLASITQHATGVGISIVLALLTCFAALVLAVTLYRLTVDQDRDIAMLAMACRLGEGVLNAIFILPTLGLMWLGTFAGANATETDAVHVLGKVLFQTLDWGTTLGSAVFALGSTLFFYLFLRGRSIPILLAWLGVAGSVLLLVVLAAQIGGFVSGPVTSIVWIPIGVAETALALWLLIKGVTQATSAGEG